MRTPGDELASPGPAMALGRGGVRAVSRVAVIAWGVIALGAALRVAVYADNRSLWLDEARLALNIIDRSYAELFGRLDFNQGAPPGFLVIEKLAHQAFGDSEYALRLTPLLCGIASLVLFWKLASTLLAPWAAVASLALFAAAEPLLYYASEVKQYGVDVFAALAVLLVAVRLRNRAPDRRHAVAVAAVGLVIVWFSHAVTITLAAATAVLIAEALRARDRQRLRVLVAVAVFWVVGAGVYAGFAARELRDIRRGWTSGLPDAFAPLPPVSVDDWRWYAENAHEFAGQLGGSDVWAVLALACAVVGAASLARRDSGAVALLLAPVALTLAASGLELYPSQVRFQLFLAPVLLILVGEALSVVRRHAGTAAFVAVFLVVAVYPWRAGLDLVRGAGREEVRPLVEHLTRDARAGDTLYVYFAAHYALSYYADCADCGTRGIARRFPIRRPHGAEAAERALVDMPPLVVLGTPGSHGPGRLAADLASLSGRERVWLLFAHDVTPAGIDERELAVASARRLGRQLAVREATGAALYLFDLTRSRRP